MDPFLSGTDFPLHDRPQRARWFPEKLEYSPIKNLRKEEDEEYVLVLKPFSVFPHVSFNKVKVGSTKICSLVICNPLSEAQDVTVIRCPSEKGFSVEPVKFVVASNSQILLEISWNPEKAFSCRETIEFQTKNGFKSKTYVMGTAFSPPKKKRKGKISNSATGSTKEKNNSTYQYNSKRSENKENYATTSLEAKTMLTVDINEIFMPETKPVFFLKDYNCNSVESPIRRQTYLINSMMQSEKRTSEILVAASENDPNNCGFTMKENQLKNYSWNKKCQSANIKDSFDNFSKLCEQGQEICVKSKSEGSELDDSLEKSSESSLEDSLALEKVFTSHTNTNEQGITYISESTGQDEIKTFDKSIKHKLFGITPTQKGTSSNCHVDDCQSFYLLKSDHDEKAQGFCNNHSGGFISSKGIVPNDRIHMENNTFALPINNVAVKNSVTICHQSLNENCLPGPSNIHDSIISDFISQEVYELQRCSTGIMSSPPALDSPSKIFSSSKVFFTNSVRRDLQQSINSDFRKLSSSCSSDEHNPRSKKTLTSKFRYIKCGTRTKVVRSPKTKLKKMKARHDPLSKSKSSPNLFKKPLKLITLKKLGSGNLSSNTLSINSGKSVAKGRSISRMARRSLHLEPKKFNLMQTTGNEVIRHPNPYATTNMYYDERWMEKQEEAFTRWLNFILTPTDEFISNEIKVDAAKLWVESMKESGVVRAPTKEDLSLQAYTVTKHLNELRKASCILYHSGPIASVIKRIEMEVDLKKISIRKDRAMHADLGIKQRMLEILLGYNPLWLRIALETIYGEIISLQSNSDVVGLSRFIIQRFLCNPDIASKYAHPKVTNLYKPGYEDELKSFTLKRFLILVFFLDKAKSDRLINHNPCLFRKNAEFKSSRDLLLVFSREYLSGEGDITKHLRYLGYKVSHKQICLEEFDYAVTNLATDLRCGIRLGRVMELLLNDWTILPSLRMNTISRLQKIHNNNVVLKALQNAKIYIDGNIQAKDIVDGDREKTLNLLWQIIFKTQISKLLNRKVIEEEIAYLQSNFELKCHLTALNALRRPGLIVNKWEDECVESKLYTENEILQLLLKWCQYVCRHYGVKVYNFSSSFSDGQALCFLLHHYHPNVLTYSSINRNTSKTYFETTMDETVSCEKTLQMDGLLKNEKDNLRLVFDKFKEVGQIPVLTSPADMSNTIPDEKVIITLVSYMNVRLMDLSIEIRAARKIQLAWRKWHLKRQLKKIELEMLSACKIQKAVRNYLKHKRLEKRWHAAVIIQCHWRGQLAKKKLSDLKHDKHMNLLARNAIMIQSIYRGYRARIDYARTYRMIVLLQSTARGFLLRRELKKQKEISSCYKIQKAVRKYLKRKKLERRWQAAITLQCHWRMQLAKKKLAAFKHEKHIILTRNAIIIQSVCRGYIARKNFVRGYQAVVLLQSAVRGFLVRRELRKQREILSACRIQKAWRNYLKHKKLERKWQAAITLQSHWKRELAKRKLAALKHEKHRMLLTKSVILIQSIYKGYRARVGFARTYRAIVLLQSTVRGFLLRRKLKKEKEIHSAFKIQKAWRNCLKRKKLERRWEAAIVIQSCWKVWVAKKMLAFLRNKNRTMLLTRNAICIQSVYKGYKARADFKRSYRAVVVIQSAVRRFLHKKQVKKEREISSACTIQKAVRNFLKRKEIERRWRAAITLQCQWRRQMAIKRLLALKQERHMMLLTKNVILIQSVYRAYRARSDFERTYRAIILLQSTVRRFLSRKKIKKQREISSVCKIQKAFRNFLKRKSLERRWQAAITLQCQWKVKLARRKLATLKHDRHMMLLERSAILIQSVYRAYRTRTDFARTYHAIVLLQSAAKRFLLRKKLRKQKEITSACTIQKAVRSYLKRKNLKRRWQASIIIQCQWRRHMAKKTLSSLKHMMLLQKSATLVQSVYRGYRARIDYAKSYRAVVVLQSAVRGFLVRRQLKKQKEITSACVIQKAVRSYLKRKNLERRWQASITIQCQWRRNLAKKTLYSLKQMMLLQKSATLVQSVYRGYRARIDYAKSYRAVVTLQSAVRGFLLRRLLKKQKEFTSACMIQKAVRSYLKRKNLEKIWQASIIIQCQWRRHLAKKTLSLLKHMMHLQKSATLVQSVYRGYRARIDYAKSYRAVVVLQSAVRGFLVRKQLKRQKEITSACLIQKAVRSYLKRKNLERRWQASIIIQCRWRRHMAKKTLSSLKHMMFLQKSATLVQSLYRGYRARINYAKSYRAVVILQSAVRGFLFRRKLKKQREILSACTIQKAVRNFLKCKEIKRRWRAAVTLQCQWRMQGAKKRLLTLKQERHMILLTKNVILIQSVYRGYRARSNFARICRSVLLLQSAARGFLVRKELRKQKKIASVCKIQKAVRKFLMHKRLERRWYAAITIQCQWKIYTAKRKLAALKCARHMFFKKIILIQAVWRGYCERKKIKNDALVKARQKIRNAESSEHMKLGNRTRRAIAMLREKHLCHIIAALQILDVSTRLSPNCCENLALSGGIDVLLKVISCCNRSVPHMEIIKLFTNIALNVAKYDKTVDYLWDTPHLLASVLNLMKMCRINNTEIFTKCASLFWIFCQDPMKAQVIKSDPTITSQIISIHDSVVHKQKSLEKQKLQTKARSAFNMDCSFLHSKNSNLNPRLSTHIEPDWILGRNWTREFKDPAAAMSAIMNSLLGKKQHVENK